jgi:maltoporin
VFGERFEFGMYGRVGLGWTPRGQIAQGKSLNVITKNQIGGRLEEGDYLEPTLKAYIVRGKEEKDLDVSMNMTFQMFNRSGSFIQAFASGFPTGGALQMEIFQAFIEAKNLGVPDLVVWGGARQYRGNDIHIADYYYFNDLNGQGGGLKYKGLDLAAIIHTAGPPDPLYNVSSGANATLDLQRQRTVFVGQYKYGLTGGSYAQGLAEFHWLPNNRFQRTGRILQTADNGWAVGAKLHMAWENGGFNSTSVRYGAGIANGAWGGSRTYETYGDPGPDGTYKGTTAYGVEAIDHFLWTFGPIFSLNAYGVLHLNHGASDAATDKRMDWALGARTFIYITDRFHLIDEATYSQNRIGTNPTGSVVKLSLVPTLVPTGKREPFARPHLRLIYTVAFYDENAVNQLMSPYLQAFGPTRIAHYIGFRTEWWF